MARGAGGGKGAGRRHRGRLGRAGRFIVWEDSAAITPPEGVTLLDTRKFGDTRISFLSADG